VSWIVGFLVLVSFVAVLCVAIYLIVEYGEDLITALMLLYISYWLFYKIPIYIGEHILK